ncbi:MAG: ATP-binding cassette domain-containing protein [Chromatiaceae bacterium]|nr:ATP-binding cassette domain-containing protein [Gammaproteobacteria bacterium]MCP5314640.1 ATP-binding cassette domain-containing protein [Chromatiaceae bacterium]
MENVFQARNKAKPIVYHLRDVVRDRASEGVTFRLRVPALQINQGEKIALIGESGCGKSTLLDMLAFIAQPTGMAAFMFRPEPEKDAIDVTTMWKKRQLNRLSDLRRRHIGYVMQTGGLLPYLTVRDNMALSRGVLGLGDSDLVETLARELGIARHLDKLPETLSVGERQRVAIGRALAHEPSIVIADEPTASVDPFAAEKIMSLFIGLAEERNITVVVASHAWRHIKRLGLRRLAHHTHRSKDGRTTETVVNG